MEKYIDWSPYGYPTCNCDYPTQKCPDGKILDIRDENYPKERKYSDEDGPVDKPVFNSQPRDPEISFDPIDPLQEIIINGFWKVFFQISNCRLI